jgi:hypothetical protein
MSILRYLREALSQPHVNFEKSEDGNYIGYKVMTVNNGKFIPAANKSLTLPINIGAIHTMPGSGIYISNDPEYVVDYYSYKEDENDPDELVIQYEFSLDDVIDGIDQIGDQEPEIGVRKAKILGLIPIDAWHEGKRF